MKRYPLRKRSGKRADSVQITQSSLSSMCKMCILYVNFLKTISYRKIHIRNAQKTQSRHDQPNGMLFIIILKKIRYQIIKS